MLLHSERAIMGFFFHFSCLEMVMMVDFPLLIWRKKNRCFNSCERVLMQGFLIEGCRTKDGSELDWLSFFNWRDVILKGRGYCFLIWLMMG